MASSFAVAAPGLARAGTSMVPRYGARGRASAHSRVAVRARAVVEAPANLERLRIITPW